MYGPDAEPLPIDWLTVVHHHDDENPLHETFALAFSDDSGVGYGWYQYDTLQIALDQAHEILGVAQEEWEVVDEDARSSPMVSWIPAAPDTLQITRCGARTPIPPSALDRHLGVRVCVSG